MIRKSTENDIDTIMQFIDYGRQKMVAEGNIHQWTKGHPSRELIEVDVARGVSYMIEDQGKTMATFALVEGPDLTYAQIYEGQWQNDNDYCVIHRVASAPDAHGVMSSVLDFAFSKTNTIRIDTHADNKTMQHLLKKHGFAYCGIIHLSNGDPRLAFQKTISANEE